MTRPKTERNKLILELADQGYTYKQILTELIKRRFTELKDVKSVGMQLSRLRKAKVDVPTSTRQPVSRITAPRRRVTKEPVTRQRVSEATEKMAFWLDRNIKEKLKILAVKERRTASDIVREILREYLKNK